MQQLYNINRSWIKEKEGYSLYDATIASAVKHFQKDAGLPQTGIADQTTINKLKSWNNSKTTVILGTRELSYSESSTDKGTDVTELVNLLTKAGFAPDPKKIVMTMMVGQSLLRILQQQFVSSKHTTTLVLQEELMRQLSKR